MISLTLYTIGKIFKADLNGDMFGVLGLVELMFFDWLFCIILFV